MALDIQDVPDTISCALARLQARFPRYPLQAPTAAIYRERLKKFSEPAIAEAVEYLIDTATKFPDLTELVAACKLHQNSSRTNGRSLLDPTPEEYEKLSLAERWMVSHAKEVVWRADFERRVRTAPDSFDGMNINAEMIAHGVEIASDGSRVYYDGSLILKPTGCPTKQPRWGDTRDYKTISAEAQRAHRDRVDELLERQAIRREEEVA